MNINIESLVINITDICNMDCPFCLRGDKTHQKLDLSLIPKIFEGISKIQNLTLTGGEPSCYPEAVTAIVEYLRENKNHIDIDGFAIITNGKIYCQELVDAVRDMYMLYVEKNAGNMQISGKTDAKKCEFWYLDEILPYFIIAVSMDEYHEPIDAVNYMKYRTSGFYSEIKEQDYAGGILARGYGTGFPGARWNEITELSIEKNKDDILVDEIYITSSGLIFADCNMSIDMENEDEAYGDLEEETLAQTIMCCAETENIYE